jgi:hypothetical protein
MRWRIGAIVETELAVVALIDHLMMVGRRELPDVTCIDVDTIEQGIERRAQIETAAAAVADVIDPQRFFVQLLRIDRINETEALHVDAGGKLSAISSQLRRETSPC